MKSKSPPRPTKSRGVMYRPLRIHDIPDRGLDRRIEATSEECGAIASAIGVPAIVALAADFQVAAKSDGRYDVTGRVGATVSQICVVSLEAFDSTVAQPVSVSFSERASETDDDVSSSIAALDLDDPVDPPDPLIDNTIDLGAIAVEFLTLALDFYPRKPGVQFTDVSIGDAGQPEPSSFAALERLKDRS